MRGFVVTIMLASALVAALPSVAATECHPDGLGVTCHAGSGGCSDVQAPLGADSACGDCSVLGSAGTTCIAKACVAGVYAGAGSPGGASAALCEGVVRDLYLEAYRQVDDLPQPVGNCQTGTPLVTAYCTGVLERCTVGVYALGSVTECEGLP